MLTESVQLRGHQIFIANANIWWKYVLKLKL